jgi:geranylgeranyl diphosphate synthase type II
MPSSVDLLLARYRDATLKALRASLPSREPRRYLYDLIAGQLSRTGKGLRPALCIATCRAFGGDLRRALPSAVALELLHNAFLVHDDIEDGSEYRRDRPTLHREHGMGIAINVGDAMYALAMRPLTDNASLLGPELARHVLIEVEHMLQQSLEGQALELGWIRDNVCALTENDYLRVVLKKTCFYTAIHPCRIGALIATGSAEGLSRFDRFGFYLGAAFQIQDDVLNLVGDRSRYGKEILGDLWEGKRTLMLVHLMAVCLQDERERLRVFLSRPRQGRMEREARWLHELLIRYGCIEYARGVARQLAAAAKQELALAYGPLPSSEDKDFLGELVRYMIEREL